MRGEFEIGVFFERGSYLTVLLASLDSCLQVDKAGLALTEAPLLLLLLPQMLD